MSDKRAAKVVSRTVLITGGTEGLGNQLARWHQRNGDQVIAVGTRPEQDAPPHFQNHPAVHYIRCDLSHIDSDQAIARELRAASLTSLHTVYLNAARGYWGRFEQQPLDQMEELLRLSFLSPILLLRAIDNLIVPDGKVKIISSVVRYLPQRDYALYAAAKSAISGAMRSFIFEHSAHYRVTLLHPGAIATGFHRKSGMGETRVAFAQKPRTVARRVAKATAGVRIIGVLNHLLRLYGSVRAIATLARGQLPQGAHNKDGAVSRDSARRQVHTRRRGNQDAGDRSPQTVVIVGAAEGIGQELARLHLATAQRLILVDNNRALLEQSVALLRQINAHDRHTKAEIVSFVGDVRTESDTVRIAEYIDRSPAPLRLYITAAVSAVGPFAAIPREALINTYQINCLPALRLLRHLIANADDKQWGIVLFSSLAAFVHYPGAACYAGTKAFVSALPFAIGRQVPAMAGSSIKAMDAGAPTTGSAKIADEGGGTLAVVYPGPIATRHAARYSPDNSRTSLRLSPTTAAERIVSELQRGKTMLFLRPSDKITAILAIAFPRLLGTIMRKAIYRKITAPLLPPQE